MRRAWLAVGLIAGLALLAAATLRLDTDARRLLGPGDDVAALLDTPEGRLTTLAVIGPDRDRRSALAAQLARELPEDPLVGRVAAGPEAPPPELVEWIWRHRFALSPPAAGAFEPEALAAELRQARAALTSAADSLLADRYLLDPTGSFRRLIAAITDPGAAALPRHNGVPQALDDSAALIFLSLADRPFDAPAQAAFDARVSARVAQQGAEALMVGPRPLSARINGWITRRSKQAATVACGLLLVWLAVTLRPARNLGLCLAPLATGFLVAALAVQLVFGGVHVIALGFGGALMGMAMDYPIHLLAHRGRPADLARARRYVGLCAATSAVAFLALLGSGVPALLQVGVFVAVGLSASAGASVLLTGPGEAAGVRLAPPMARPVAAPWKLPVLGAVAVASGLGIAAAPERGPQRLIEPPPDVIEAVVRMGRMVELPSGRYRIEVTGADLAEVLDRQAALGVVLDAMASEGVIMRTEMLAAHLPPRAASVPLPEASAFAARLPEALAAAGLAPGFAPRVAEAYVAARDLAPPDAGALDLLARMPELAVMVSAEGDRVRAPVRLWGLSDPAAASAVEDAAIPGVAFVDTEAAIAGSLSALTLATGTWMAAGAAAGVLVLFLTLRPLAAAAEIAFGCLTAGLATAAVVGFVTGGLGLFHIVALALVIGVGIDYGLFLTLSGTGRDPGSEFATALRSVLICAASTLIAFLTMALSGVNVLEDIGITLSVGVLAMLAVHLLRRGPAGAGTG